MSSTIDRDYVRTTTSEIIRTASRSLFVSVKLPARMALLALVVSNVTAADWYVSNAGNDLNSCMSPLFSCQTIQAAVNKAAPGDIIHVAPGIYPDPASGPLTIDKKLTLLGSQVGADARTRVGTESIV